MENVDVGFEVEGKAAGFSQEQLDFLAAWLAFQSEVPREISDLY